MVSVGEENYLNKVWEDPEAYARKIRLFKIGDRYTLLDVPTSGNNHPDVRKYLDGSIHWRINSCDVCQVHHAYDGQLV